MSVRKRSGYGAILKRKATKSGRDLAYMMMWKEENHEAS